MGGVSATVTASAPAGVNATVAASAAGKVSGSALAMKIVAGVLAATAVVGGVTVMQNRNTGNVSPPQDVIATESEPLAEDNSSVTVMPSSMNDSISDNMNKQLARLTSNPQQ